MKKIEEIIKRDNYKERNIEKIIREKMRNRNRENDNERQG